MESGTDRFEIRFDGLENRFDGLEKRFDGLEKHIDGLEDRIDGLDKRLVVVEVRLDALDERVEGRDARLGMLEQGFVRVETQLAHVIAGQSELAKSVKEIGGELHAAKIWALFLMAAILGVMAKGFHWF